MSKNLKFEVKVTIILLISLFGVVFWYILYAFKVRFANEITILTTIICLISFITYLLHGKGILPLPNNDSLFRKEYPYNSPNYNRKKYHITKYERSKWTFTFKKQIVETKSEMNRILPFSYERKKYH